MSGLVTPYALFVAFAALLAILERLYALTNERRLRSEGAREIAPAVFLWMVPVYASHFLAALLEHAARASSPPRAWVVAMAALFLASKGLKAWAILHLDGLFTMRVFIPVRPVIVQSGPYRLMRHPNYVAVVGEMAALPLLGGAWVTAIVFGAAFLVILRARVVSEEEALFGVPEYAARMAHRRRFLLLAVLLAAAPAAARPALADPLSLRLDPALSSLTFTISRPGETVEGKAPALSGEVRVDPERPEQGASVLLRVEAAALDTGNGIRDRKMRKSHLEAEAFPQIVFQSTAVSFQDAPGPLRPGTPRQAMVEGRLDLHGVARTIRIPVLLRYDGASLAADGEVAFALSDHAIPIPRFLWMVLDDKVTVRFHVVTGKAG